MAVWGKPYRVSTLPLMGSSPPFEVVFYRPWTCMGDFNEITEFGDKDSGSNSPRQGMREFQECLDDCDFRGLPFHVNRFTWEKGKSENAFIRERFNRGISYLS